MTFTTRGEKYHQAILKVNCEEKQKQWFISRTPKVEPELQEQWPKPTSYSGALTSQVYSHENSDGMNVAVSNVDFLKKYLCASSTCKSNPDTLIEL